MKRSNSAEKFPTVGNMFLMLASVQLEVLKKIYLNGYDFHCPLPSCVCCFMN